MYTNHCGKLGTTREVQQVGQGGILDAILREDEELVVNRTCRLLIFFGSFTEREMYRKGSDLEIKDDHHLTEKRHPSCSNSTCHHSPLYRLHISACSSALRITW
jgi:hypothetical protein